MNTLVALLLIYAAYRLGRLEEKVAVLRHYNSPEAKRGLREEETIKFELGRALVPLDDYVKAKAARDAAQALMDEFTLLSRHEIERAQLRAEQRSYGD